MELFNEWSAALELRHDKGYENELFVACILLQGAAEGIAERGKELHNLNSVYWSDTMETVSYYALGEYLGCCDLTGDILGKSSFWKLFDVFRGEECLAQLEGFESRLLSEYKEGSVFHQLLEAPASAPADAACAAADASSCAPAPDSETCAPTPALATDASSCAPACAPAADSACTAADATATCDTTAVNAVPISPPVDIPRSRFNHTRRVRGRRAITPIKNSTRHHKTPVKSILKKPS
jgi:hypothetical protein